MSFISLFETYVVEPALKLTSRLVLRHRQLVVDADLRQEQLEKKHQECVGDVHVVAEPLVSVAPSFYEKNRQEGDCKVKEEKVNPENDSQMVLELMKKLFQRFLFLVVLVIDSLHSHQGLQFLAPLTLQEVAVAAEKILFINKAALE